MTQRQTSGVVECVAMRRGHHFSKTPALEIELVEGLGVRGDGHFGATVQHRFDRRYTPYALNLRQVHLIAIETLQRPDLAGFKLQPGDLGENITTSGIDLLALPTATRLDFGEAMVELTGVREPCVQMNRFRDGLMAHFVDIDDDGRPSFTCGAMGVVLRSGIIRSADAIQVLEPTPPHQSLKKV